MPQTPLSCEFTADELLCLRVALNNRITIMNEFIATVRAQNPDDPQIPKAREIIKNSTRLLVKANDYWMVSDTVHHDEEEVNANVAD